MSELFNDLPFNLSGETQSSELTSEAEARIRALAAINARQQQRNLFTNVTERHVKNEIKRQQY